MDECIQSALNQTYPQIEVILYDDSSKDNSVQVAKKYREQIKLINGKEKFEFPAFNQANGINKSFEVCKGEIICLLDSDDYFTLDKVEKVVNVFKRSKCCLGSACIR